MILLTGANLLARVLKILVLLSDIEKEVKNDDLLVKYQSKQMHTDKMFSILIYPTNFHPLLK